MSWPPSEGSSSPPNGCSCILRSVPELLTLDDVAQTLKVSRPKVVGMVQLREIPPFQLAYGPSHTIYVAALRAMSCGSLH